MAQQQPYTIEPPKITGSASGNPRDAAIQTGINSSKTLQSLVKSVSGGKRQKKFKCKCNCYCPNCRKCLHKHKHIYANPHVCQCNCKYCKKCLKLNRHNVTRKLKRKYFAKAGAVTPPQFTMLYKSPEVPSQGVNGILSTNTKISTQADANAVYDKYATVKGGYTYRSHNNRTSTSSPNLANYTLSNKTLKKYKNNLKYLVKTFSKG